MTDPPFWSVEFSAGSILVLSFVVFFVGVSMYLFRGGLRGSAPPSHAYFVWERSFIMAGVVLTAIGFELLGTLHENTDGDVLARIGATAYLFGGVLVVAAEASSLAEGFGDTYPLRVVYFVLAFLAEAAIGGSLLQADALPAWIGWATIVWNMGWMVAGLIRGPGVWIPILPHVMPFLIGIAILSQIA